MDDCFQSTIVNCASGHTCDSGYECCSQKIPSGEPPKLGLCVKSGTCDTKRGICKSNRKNIPGTKEHFYVNSMEGFNCKCENGYLMPVLISISVMIFVLIVYACFKK